MEPPPTRCNHCGAPLRGGDEIPLVACPSCGHSLDGAQAEPPMSRSSHLRHKLEDLDIVGRKNRLLQWYHIYGVGFGDEKAARLTRITGRTGGLIAMLLFTAAALCFVIGSHMLGAPLIIQLITSVFVVVGVLTLAGILRQPATGVDKTKVEGQRRQTKKRNR